ncbi:MAG: LysM peptidoglycan-binding domain-containing protein [Actinomycetales bacterium]|nr:LysM peptidoglycan-binding domain-containing protein [Actinomycetales bacterium]
MNESAVDEQLARAVFAGLTPSAASRPLPEVLEVPRPHDPGAMARSLRATMPFVLAGAMTVSLHLTGPVSPADAVPRKSPKPERAEDARERTGATTVADAAPKAVDLSAIPATHAVLEGETVSSIATAYGLSTASVLALNGLGWKSLIFPGQVLRLTSGGAPAPATATSAATMHKVVRGDTVSRIAAHYGVSTQSVLDANGLTWSSIIYPGQRLVIPDEATGTVPERPTELDLQLVADITPAPEAAPADAPAPAPAAPAPAPVRYTVVSGDTLSGIAGRFGISTQALLDANGLAWSSIIYPGQTLGIPAGSGSGGSGSSGGGSGSTSLSGEQEGNARLIIQVGRDLGIPDYGIIIALATAMQESSLRNLDYGDRDSLGLFQQRPSQGWGSPSEVTDPYYATRTFFLGKSGIRGLLDISGWQSMSVAQAAQAVQISAYPDAYAKWEAPARSWFAALG